MIEQRRLLASLAGLVPAMQARAIQLDRDTAFPLEDFTLLRNLGALTAPIPEALGGLGMGTEPAGALPLMEALRLLGRGSLCVGRLYEAHVNAVRLIVRTAAPPRRRTRLPRTSAPATSSPYGSPTRPASHWAWRPTAASPAPKSPCSGAGHATRALVTVTAPDGQTTMRVLKLPAGERADLTAWDPHGMRASLSGHMDLAGLPAGEPIGRPGDYLRQPDFSAGAWRTSAVTLGGIEALTAELRSQLVARDRAGDPHQRARVGEALIAQETARLWVRRAALLGEAERGRCGYGRQYGQSGAPGGGGGRAGHAAHRATRARHGRVPPRHHDRTAVPRSGHVSAPARPRRDPDRSRRPFHDARPARHFLTSACFNAGLA